MRSRSATFFYDQLLVKEAGTAERTPLVCTSSTALHCSLVSSAWSICHARGKLPSCRTASRYAVLGCARASDMFRVAAAGWHPSRQRGGVRCWLASLGTALRTVPLHGCDAVLLRPACIASVSLSRSVSLCLSLSLSVSPPPPLSVSHCVAYMLPGVGMRALGCRRCQTHTHTHTHTHTERERETLTQEGARNTRFCVGKWNRATVSYSMVISSMGEFPQADQLVATSSWFSRL